MLKKKFFSSFFFSKLFTSFFESTWQLDTTRKSVLLQIYTSEICKIGRNTDVVHTCRSIHSSNCTHPPTLPEVTHLSIKHKERKKQEKRRHRYLKKYMTMTMCGMKNGVK